MNGIRATTTLPGPTSAQYDLLMARMRDRESEKDAGETAKLAQNGDVREKFQDFVAGTFYKTMLKSLRSGQKPPKYLNGGQTEKIFQQHLDGIVTDDLARTHGAAFSEPLFKAYAQQRKLSEGNSSAQTQEAAHVVDVAV